MPASATNDGASHFRRLANARVIPARSNAQIGSRINECVMLRCHVTMSSLSLEKKSRITSESGKMAPSISDHVMMRPRFIGCEANMSSPRKTAFPISAPAIPCVIVSIVRVYPMRSGGGILADKKEPICFGDDFADAASDDAMAFKSRDGIVSGLWGDGNQQTAGSLRIEEKFAMFRRDALCKTHAIANEIAVISQSTGKKSSSCGFDGAGKKLDCGVVDLQGHGFDSPLGIPKCHLARMAEQSESRNVCDGMNRTRLFLHFLQRFGGRAIQLGHGGNRYLQV